MSPAASSRSTTAAFRQLISTADCFHAHGSGADVRNISEHRRSLGKEGESRRDCLTAEITTTVPASILRTHPNAVLFLDGDSATMLPDQAGVSGATNILCLTVQEDMHE